MKAYEKLIFKSSLLLVTEDKHAFYHQNVLKTVLFVPPIIHLFISCSCQAEETTDPVIINALMEFCKTMHGSVK